MHSVNQIAIVAASIVASVSGLPASNTQDGKAVWEPSSDAQYQIVLSGSVSLGGNLSPDVDIWDIDLFDTPADTIRGLKSQGKDVICYFSAGTSEDWRPDYSKFKESDKGSCLPEWAGERYINIKSQNVLSIMNERIKYAASVGCDAIDPDNVDGFSNNNGLSLTASDYADYVRKLAAEAAKYGMGTGLKNAQPILPYVKDVVQFAVNEECALGGDYGSCAPYADFGKPTYHIEYVQNRTVGASQRAQLCLQGNEVPGFFTIIKELDLGGWGMFCDGTMFTTATTEKVRMKGVKELACTAKSGKPTSTRAHPRTGKVSSDGQS